MATSIDLQEMAASALSIIQSLQNTATELTGLECLWARATPQINSEDVVLQEYTLSNVGLECPQQLKILTSNSDYNPGNFTVDLFGINYDAPLEVQITISIWESVFGKNTMPQKGDVVYIKLLHKLYEVATSQVIYQIASIPTYFKCQLVKYNPVASRKETEEFRVAIDELTVTQEDLFGDAISQEVADTVNTVETAYNNTSSVDPLKDYDIRSIVREQIYGPNGVLVSNAYYNFIKADQNITYHVEATYPGNEERIHWIYSCWFKQESQEIQQGKIIHMEKYSQDKNFWYFTLNTSIELEIGDIVTITRGSLIKISGTIVTLQCECGYGIQFKYGDITKANKKLTEWWKTNNMRIYKVAPINLLTAYNGEDQIIRINYLNSLNKLSVKFNNVEKEFIMPYMDLDYWTFLLFDLSYTELHIIAYHIKQTAVNKIVDEEIFNHIEKINLKDFDVTEFRIESINTGLQICNIRLYENEFEIGDTYLKEMYEPISRNANKLILVDSPNIPNMATFDSPVR